MGLGEELMRCVWGKIGLLQVWCVCMLNGQCGYGGSYISLPYCITLDTNRGRMCNICRISGWVKKVVEKAYGTPSLKIKAYSTTARKLCFFK